MPEAKKGLKKETRRTDDDDFWKASEDWRNSKHLYLSVLPSVKVLKAVAGDRLVELQLFLNSSELKS